MYPRSIYKITHIPTGRVYVGSSHNPEFRLKSHLSALRNGRHPVEDMQADFDELGENYNFSIIGRIEDESEDHKEYDCMLECNSNMRGIGYNYKDKKCPRITPEDQLLEIIEKSDNPALTTKVATIICLTMHIQEQMKELAQIVYASQQKEA
jgi:CRISPR/Cas system CMR-associated protein Cmr1 (group 7 of RAMP superfamily)